MVAIDGETK